ncbi:hypothetical protein GTP91_25285 [Rugamonas sp. FT82W]|uniref:DUF3828 domain-containing protein n=1 Tax=Duganella vulcania TaxID=2692166 RepID=A0A845G700_9BURK|nr:hypothetical protein [Duganella vulcania]MYM90473.1 hypothetical protein [Duganella vulcania]
MSFNKKHYLPTAALVGATAIAVASLLAYKARSERQQVDFITGFYKSYLGDTRRAPPPPGTFYSPDLEDLLATNHELCGKLARNGEICGYDADDDVFLNLGKAGFKAAYAGDGNVDVSFNAFPGQGGNHQRQIRFVLTLEDAGWRVDDMLSGASALRRDVLHENETLLARTRTSGGTATKAASPP